MKMSFAIRISMLPVGFFMPCRWDRDGLVRSRSCKGVHVGVRDGDGRVRSGWSWHLRAAMR